MPRPTKLPIRIFWRNHVSSGSFVRVWREDWGGDTFEVMARENLQSLISLTRGMIEVVEADEGE